MLLSLAVLLSGCGKEKRKTIPEPIVIQLGGAAGKVFDYEFVKRKYFFIDDPDTLVATSLRERRVASEELAVFVDKLGNGGIPGSATYEWATTTLDGQPRHDVVMTNRVTKLVPNEDYYFYNSAGIASPYLVLRNAIEEAWTLAVAYRLRDDAGAIVGDVGNFFSRAQGDTLRLKMIRPGNPYLNARLAEGAWAPTRRLEMKNVYDLGARGIDAESLHLKVFRQDGATAEALDGVSYLEVLGLDLVDNQTGLARESTVSSGAARGPDGKIDREYVDYESGVLFMPDLRPFAPSCIDLSGAARCSGAENNLGSRSPGRTSPRRRALGWRRVGGPGASGLGPLFGYHFESIGADSAAAEVNPGVYDSRDPRADLRKYYLAGYFLGPG